MKYVHRVSRALSLGVMAVLLAIWYEKDRRRFTRRHP
jgi:hypothetical protein